MYRIDEEITDATLNVTMYTNIVRLMQTTPYVV